ncbi:MAG: radical SAM protein [Bacilli bacterium]|nr:radical SAM protein [Bacilli bacterium]
MKKIYIEITNNCNLNCNFCIHNKRLNQFMKIEDFKKILLKIKPYTKYLYFHILGEPLLHPKVNEFIDEASKEFYINITTNGYLINNLKSNKVRQINISLHSYDKRYNVDLEEYLNNIFKTVDQLNNTYISYRFWIKNKYSKKILEIINKHYKTNFKLENLKKSNTIKNNIYINTYNEFIWPDLNNNYYNEKGECYGLKDHIGILVDGTIVPCCLDTKANINLGNIYKDDLKEMLNSKRVKNMLEGFKKGEKREELCKKCNFLNLDS